MSKLVLISKQHIGKLVSDAEQIASNKQQKEVKMDSARLIERIEQSGLKKNFIADKIGISYSSLQNKVHGRTDFTARESLTLKHLLQMPEEEYIDIFFASDVPYKKQEDD